MVNLLRDPIWQFIGVIIALSALILSFWLYKKQTTKKELLWDITKCISLSSFNISEKVKSTILFERTRLEDVSLIYLKLWNSGTVEIRPEDYMSPLKFQFGKDAQILEAKILSSEPINIEDFAAVSSSKNSITLQPLLLNSKDSLVLEALLTKFSGNLAEITIDGRIAGVKHISRPYENESYGASVGISLVKTFASWTWMMVLGLLAFALCGGIFFLASLPIANNFVALANLFIFEMEVAALATLPCFILSAVLKDRLRSKSNTPAGKLIYLLAPLALFLVLMIISNVILIIAGPNLNHPIYHLI